MLKNTRSLSISSCIHNIACISNTIFSWVNNFAFNCYLRPRSWDYCQLFYSMQVSFRFHSLRTLWDALRHLYLRISAQRFEPGGLIEQRRFRIIFLGDDQGWSSLSIQARFTQFVNFPVSICFQATFHIWCCVRKFDFSRLNSNFFRKSRLQPAEVRLFWE